MVARLREIVVMIADGSSSARPVTNDPFRFGLARGLDAQISGGRDFGTVF